MCEWAVSKDESKYLLQRFPRAPVASFATKHLHLRPQHLYMRVEQKVHESGFLCVSLWVCNEQSRLKFFSEMAKDFFFLPKVLAKVHVDMSEFAL